jgi:hypothetical protein
MGQVPLAAASGCASGAIGQVGARTAGIAGSAPVAG